MLLYDFPGGILRMSSHPYVAEGNVLFWLENPLNCTLLCAEALLLLLVVKDLIQVYGFIGACMWHSKSLVTIEHNLRYARIRDKVALCTLPLLVMEFSGMGMLGMTLPRILAVLFGYYIARRLLYAVVKRGKVPMEVWLASRNAPNVFVVMLASLWVATMAVMLSAGVSHAVVEQVMLIELGAVAFICLNRQFGILKLQCGSFRSFLYLCALEILPMAGVVCVVLLIS